jgi:membrane-associated PAP2 superfamily phosphatase
VGLLRPGLRIALLFGGPQGFAWRDHWLLAGLMHNGGEAIATGIVALLLVGVWWLATTVANALGVALVRRSSLTSCPWSLMEFGGTAGQHVSHGACHLRDGGPGSCFPSGHAAAGFAFLPGWFVLRRSAPAAASAWLAAALAAGLCFGAIQVVRGAHFPRHVLWSGWLCWATAVVARRGAERFVLLRSA